MSSLDRPTALRYIESSALVAAAIEQDAAAIASLRADGPRLTSALTFAEAERAVVRAAVAGRLTKAQERAAVGIIATFRRRCEVIAVTADVLRRVGHRYPVEPIRTVDAIHLASAESLGESPAFVTIVTRDSRLRENAQALGYTVE